jgi:hypothetical protein
VVSTGRWNSELGVRTHLSAPSSRRRPLLISRIYPCPPALGSRHLGFSCISRVLGDRVSCILRSRLGGCGSPGPCNPRRPFLAVFVCGLWGVFELQSFARRAALAAQRVSHTIILSMLLSKAQEVQAHQSPDCWESEGVLGPPWPNGTATCSSSACSAETRGVGVCPQISHVAMLRNCTVVVARR